MLWTLSNPIIEEQMEEIFDKKMSKQESIH